MFIIMKNYIYIFLIICFILIICNHFYVNTPTIETLRGKSVGNIGKLTLSTLNPNNDKANNDKANNDKVAKAVKLGNLTDANAAVSSANNGVTSANDRVVSAQALYQDSTNIRDNLNQYVKKVRGL